MEFNNPPYTPAVSFFFSFVSFLTAMICFEWFRKTRDNLEMNYVGWKTGKGWQVLADFKEIPLKVHQRLAENFKFLFRFGTIWGADCSKLILGWFMSLREESVALPRPIASSISSMSSVVEVGSHSGCLWEQTSNRLCFLSVCVISLSLSARSSHSERVVQQKHCKSTDNCCQVVLKCTAKKNCYITYQR